MAKTMTITVECIPMAERKPAAGHAVMFSLKGRLLAGRYFYPAADGGHAYFADQYGRDVRADAVDWWAEWPKLADALLESCRKLGERMLELSKQWDEVFAPFRARIAEAPGEPEMVVPVSNLLEKLKTNNGANDGER